MNIQKLNGSVMASSVYAAGTQIGVNVHIKLPDVTPTETEITAAGGVISVPLYSKIEAMECTINKAGIDSAWLRSIKPEPCDIIANIVQQSVATDGTTSPVHIKAYMRAVPKVINGLDATYGEAMELELPFSVFSYKLTVDGETYTHIDPVKGLYTVNGTDYNSKIIAMI